MAIYTFGQDKPNPFLADPPQVIVVRHVRVTPAGETVAEDANILPRIVRRVDYNRVHPRDHIATPIERTVPSSPGTRRKLY